jgi:type I restriction enzyme S subunit
MSSRAAATRFDTGATVPGVEPPIDLATRDWAEVVRVLREQVPDLAVWAFGSRTRRTAKRFSDLDLALMTSEPLSLDRLAAINDAFATSDLPIFVDVVDWATANDDFRQRIAQDAVVLQPG